MSLIHWLLHNNRAFTDPANAVGDAIRIVDICLGMVMFGLFIRVARQVRNTRQWGMYALVCFGVSACGTEIERLGQIVTYRLVFNTAGVVLGIVFLVKTSKGKSEYIQGNSTVSTDHLSSSGGDTEGGS